MPQDDFSPRHPVGLTPDLDACLRNIQRWIVQQGPTAAQPSVARGISQAQGTDDTVGQIPEARVVWDTSGGHNHASGNARAVPISGDVTGTNQAALVAQIQAIPVAVPVIGDDQQFLRYNNGVPNLTWESPARQIYSVVTKTANYTLTDADDVVLVDASAGAITITLQAVATAHKHPFYLKKIDASANAVTLDAAGAELIENALTYSLPTQFKAAIIFPTGTAWYVLGIV